MNCPNCGAANPEGSAFCHNCGASLAQGNTPADYQGGGYASAPPQHKSNLVPILIAAVLIVLIVTVGAVVIMRGNNGGSAPAPAAVQTEAVTEVQATTTTTTTEPETTTTTTTTTAAPATQALVQKIYIYPGYDGGAGDGYEYIGEDGFLFPSDREYLTYGYLDSLSRNQEELVRNEIYARHGYIFKRNKFKDYFNTQSWYHGYEPDMATVERSFNSVEQENIRTLVKYEKAKGWRQ